VNTEEREQRDQAELAAWLETEEGKLYQIEGMAEVLAEAWYELNGHGHTAELAALVLEAYDQTTWGDPVTAGDSRA
jgi:hypothetical protein